MIRVSTLEAFRRFLHDEEAERFNPNIPETPAMRAGTAFHKALENSQPGELETITSMGHTFEFECNIDIYIPAVREVRAWTKYGCLSVTGQVDCMDGKRVEDHKTTSYPNMERFIEGYQWRFYLDMFGADVFRWNIFTLRQDDDDPVRYFVTGFDTLEQFRYAGLHDDCMALAHKYIEYQRQIGELA